MSNDSITKQQYKAGKETIDSKRKINDIEKQVNLEGQNGGN
jgi:hypothetical protein